MRTYGIDINTLTLPNRTGTERYVFSLISHMMQEPLCEDESVQLYAARPIRDLPTLPQCWTFQELHWPLPKGWTHGRLSWELIRRAPNVFFTPAHEIPRFHARTKIVTTVHDVAFRRYPKLYSGKSRRRQEWAVRHAMKQASRLITVSETTKRDLMELYRVPGDMITAIPHAIDPGRFSVDKAQVQNVLRKYRLGAKRYFFFVGRIEAKKNILTLLEAFEVYKRDRGVGDPTQLVLAGTFGEGADHIRKKLTSLHTRGNVKLLGYVPEKDLAPLMKGALAYVFPSWYEGFGIPALEAFAAEVPLIASDIPALREVAGDAAIFASPKHPAVWTDALHDVALKRIDVDRLVEKGRERLKLFSWERTARETWSVLRSV